jgi:hypothetical protein
VAEKKSSKKAPAAPAPQPTPAPPAVASDAPKVLGPGVVKRPKRDPSAPVPGGPEDLNYKPSEQVFRRRS